MIKFIRNSFLSLSVVYVFSACEMFKIDNYEGPDATVRGSIIDKDTKELVETDMVNGSFLRFKQLGDEWAVGGFLDRVVMQNGEYQDKMFFAGVYSLEFLNCNFYPHKYDTIQVKKGDNVFDWEVTPYIRVKNVNIRQEGTEIVATFNLQAGKPEVRLSNISMFYSTDIYAGEGFTRFPLGGTSFKQSFSPAVVIDPAVTYRLAIDLTNQTNKTNFKYKRDYYFRVGAIASVSGVGTVRRNYAPCTIINFNVSQ